MTRLTLAQILRIRYTRLLCTARKHQNLGLPLNDGGSFRVILATRTRIEFEEGKERFGFKRDRRTGYISLYTYGLDSLPTNVKPSLLIGALIDARNNLRDDYNAILDTEYVLAVEV